MKHSHFIIYTSTITSIMLLVVFYIIHFLNEKKGKQLWFLCEPGILLQRISQRETTTTGFSNSGNKCCMVMWGLLVDTCLRKKCFVLTVFGSDMDILSWWNKLNDHQGGSPKNTASCIVIFTFLLNNQQTKIGFQRCTNIPIMNFIQYSYFKENPCLETMDW